MNTIRVAIIGLGSRGRGFASMVHEHPNATVVAVAEPIDSSRQAAAETFGLADDMVFRDWQSFVSARPDCDAVGLRPPSDPALTTHLYWRDI